MIAVLLDSRPVPPPPRGADLTLSYQKVVL